ncbi:flagellin N-terminal helical domain-containing protein [Butyrivibrio sp. WCE2006]|uniref:flagellin N-terminal helical domain-containing protein n=1 Tax=Butyrivibrio sp. WCE2006 TaxID=1410611 RepID=UPI0006785FC7|nr:flagellin [Butyrivibrio sp. WCE2006]
MQVNYNISAMIANNALVANDNKLAESIERLSSGLKIANAKDNPSGLAISRRMNAQIKGLGVAGGNSGDGISVIQTADGTLSEVHDILQRMSELAIQAANGTNSDSDLEIIQDEIAQLKDEITRISDATQFNGQTLLDGSFDFRGYSTLDKDTDPLVTVNTYSDVIDSGNYYFEEIYCSYDDNSGKITLLDSNGYRTDSVKIDVTKITKYQGRETEINYMYQASVSVDGDLLKISTRDGKELEIKVNKNLKGERIDLELTRKGAMTMQVGANEGQVLDIRIPRVTLSNLGIAYVDVSRTYKTDLIDAVEFLNSDEVKQYLYGSEITAEDIIDTTFYNSKEGVIDYTRGLKDEEPYHFINVDEARKIVEKLRRSNSEIAGLDPWDPDYDQKKAQIQENFWEYTKEIERAADERIKEAPHTGADQAITDIGSAIQKISAIRSRLGAYQNRLDHTVSNINTTSENMTAAYSRIMDVDMADEMTVYSTQQVLSQAGTSMLAQANERPQQILQLLQ